jgi:D-glycero-alpha-D-manno-heptose 1-phosphate guanylyltransferase
MEVIILAGGLGTRLRSVVSEVPKCMAPVAGKPFLWYLLEGLRRFYVDRVILSVGYLREVIEKWVAEHSSEYPFEFCFAVEKQPLGTGGGIKLAASLAKGSEVIVLNGDTWYDADLERLMEFRRECGKPIAVALKPMHDFDRYGRVELAPDGTVTAFREKQHCADGLINGGVYALDRDSGIFGGLPEKFSFEKDILEPQCAAGNLCGLVQDGYFIDIGIPEDYSRACNAPWMLCTSCDTLLLDRDGVINVLRQGDYVKTVGEFEWMPGIKEALKDAAAKFRHIFVVTNQRGVGRGVMTREALDGIHDWMKAEIAAAGGRIDGIYVCTAVSDDDPCRKPNRGLFDAILRDHPDVTPSRTVMVGDSPSDAAFAHNCQIRFFTSPCGLRSE